MITKSDIFWLAKSITEFKGTARIVLSSSNADMILTRECLSLFGAAITHRENESGGVTLLTDLPFSALAGLDRNQSFPRIGEFQAKLDAEDARQKQRIAELQAASERRWQALDDQNLLNPNDEPHEYNLSVHWRACQRAKREQEQLALERERQHAIDLERLEHRRQLQEDTAKRQAQAAKKVREVAV